MDVIAPECRTSGLRRARSVCGWLGAVAAGLIAGAAHGESWLPISTEELQMTSEAKAPKAPAVILYRRVERDDEAASERQYIRIKILTEEGREYADVSIPYDKSTEQIRDLEARTIQPDGSVVKFDGSVYETPIAKSRDTKLVAKTFTMPDAHVGSIIEYRYTHYLRPWYVFDSHWILSDQLFTRFAQFYLNPSRDFSLRYSWPMGLPDGTEVPHKAHGRIELETHDVAAFVHEEYAPPDDELKYRVDFVYQEGDIDANKDPAVFWSKTGKKLYSKVDDFVDERRAMEKVVAQITSPGDTPEEKLRKIYARVQTLRNTSFERARSPQEIERDPEKNASNVADVWNHGYADGPQITWLFMALARAAGFQADPVMVPSRSDYFFNQRVMNANQLNTNLVIVKLDGKDSFFDPGTVFTPFGMLPWPETAVPCLRLEKTGGSWVNSPLPEAAQSRVVRQGEFHVDEAGDLSGTLRVTYTGLEALWRRVRERNEDDSARRAMLEADLKAAIPADSEVSMTQAPDWQSSDPSMVAEFTVVVKGWVTEAGRRRVLNLALFGAGERHLFDHAFREHPLYFQFRSQASDDLSIVLPTGWEAASLPKPAAQDKVAFKYAASAEVSGRKLTLKRDLTVNALLLGSEYYDTVRAFYQGVRASDEQQLVLTVAANPTGEQPRAAH
jgi:hypothetical protein